MAKTTLTLDIEYAPESTDPESLACAMDRLMKTALSTPDILDEYGNPHVGEFFVAPEASGPPGSKPLVVVEIAGGVLQEAYSSAPGIKLAVLDCDTEGCTPAEDDSIVEIAEDAGRSRYVSVVDFPITPLADLAGTDAAKALNKAGIDYQPDAGPQTETVRRWVIYNPDFDAPVTTRVYDSYEAAVEDTAQLHDVLVLPLTYENVQCG